MAEGIELIPIRVAAERLGVGLSTAVHLVARGDLQLFLVPSATGRRQERYVRKDEVEKLRREGWRQRRPRGSRPSDE